ncbi:hypothetical protein K1719_029088 [Acacia pycnantha]|nr:hypothetical protein K1719_029088 [Acacia pycnantha]
MCYAPICVRRAISVGLPGARQIEQEAYAAAGDSASAEDDDIEILRAYSKEISNSMRYGTMLPDEASSVARQIEGFFWSKGNYHRAAQGKFMEHDVSRGNYLLEGTVTSVEGIDDMENLEDGGISHNITLASPIVGQVSDIKPCVFEVENSVEFIEQVINVDTGGSRRLEEAIGGDQCYSWAPFEKKVGFDSSFVEEARGFSGGIWILWKSQDAQDWKHVTKDTKDKAFTGVLQKKFKLREQHKRYVIMKALSQRNTRSRAQQRVHHMAGTKTFAVTYSEMEKKAREENTHNTFPRSIYILGGSWGATWYGIWAPSSSNLTSRKSSTSR